MGIALAISIPIVLFMMILLGFTFMVVKQKLQHERHMLALQKGLPVPLEPVTAGPRSKLLLWIALLVPPFCALVALGITIWAFSDPSIPFRSRLNPWDITGIAFIAAGWTACVVVSATAVIVVVRSFIVAARQHPSVPMKPPESHHP
jgi:hypothetical protein